MIVVVVTGGIGAGKSEAAEYLQRRGAVVLDLDRISSHLLEPDSPVLERIVSEFGPDVLADDGTLNRSALAERAFASCEDAERLNRLVHPAVAREVGPAVTDLRLLPSPPPVVAILVPLLSEAPVFAELGDTVLAIEAPEDERLRRCVSRGMSRADVERRIACQATDDERRAYADVVIVNDGTLEAFVEKLDDFWVEAVHHGPA